MKSGVLLWVSLGVLLIGCVDTAAPKESQLVDEHEGFRVVARSLSPDSPSSSGTINVQVEAIAGWHIAPEAPLRLDLEGDGIELAPAQLRREHARSISEEGIDFATQLRAERAGAASARGKLKFGICRELEDKCIIMRREFEIPVTITFASVQ